MDEHRLEMAHRLKCILEDKGDVGVMDLLKVLRGLRRSGNVFELQDVTSELEGKMKRDDSQDWLRRVIGISNLETTLLFLKSALREKRHIPKERQAAIVGILAKELNGLKEGTEKRAVSLLTSCFHYARMAFSTGDYVKSIDGMMNVALERVYGFDTRFLRVEDEKWDLWDEHVLAAAMGWMGRKGEGWKMVAAFDCLVERVKEEKVVEVEEYDWRGRRKTAYFDENQGRVEPVQEAKPTASVLVEGVADDEPRFFDDFYPSPSMVASTSTLPSHDLVTHAALYEMMKHATHDLKLALHITRIGVIYAKEEQAKWLQSVLALSKDPDATLHRPRLRFHQTPLQHLYTAARFHVRGSRHPTRFPLFIAIQSMLKDVSERLDSERAILLDHAEMLERMFSDGKTVLNPKLYLEELRTQEVLIKRMTVMGDERLLVGQKAKSRRKIANKEHRAQRWMEESRVMEIEREIVVKAERAVEEPVRLVRTEEEGYRLGLSGV
jgi:hypothetical protein